MSSSISSLCLVTFFIDIGRNHWNKYNRTVNTYLNAFTPYLNMKEDLIVFIKSNIYDIVLKLATLSKKTNIKILLLTDEIVSQIKSFKYIVNETEIMNTQKYLDIIGDRDNPENKIPMYNVLQHCKTDFIKYVIDHNLTNCPYIAWTDFGYFTYPHKIPTDSFDLNKIDKTRINYCTISPVPDNDIYTVENEISNPHEIIGGFFFIGNKEKHLEFNDLYHKTLNTNFYNKGLVDDDQHIVLRCYYNNKNLFKLWNIGWHNSYIFFQFR